MADDDPEAAAAAALLCWAELGEVHLVATSDEALAAELELGTGRTNKNFIATSVADPSKRFFVRIGEDLPVYGVTRAKEQAAIRAAAEAGITAPVLYTSPSSMVTEFCAGRTLTEADVRGACSGEGDVMLLAELGVVLRRLHATPAPPELSEGGGGGGATGWAPGDLSRWLALAEEKGYSRLPVLADARSVIASLEAAAGECGAPCFCHFDLLPDNLIRSPAPARGENDGEHGVVLPRSVAIVDYEYAGVGQPLMDLAIMSMGCSLNPAEEAALLAAYTQSEPTPELLRRVEVLKVLACVRETFWGVVAEVSGGSALPMETAVQYADENYAKLQKYRTAFVQRSAKQVAARWTTSRRRSECLIAHEL